MHFGLYSLLGGEWKGEDMGGVIGEWAQSYFRIPNKEYEKLAEVFNPIYFDAEEIVKMAKEAGMNYLVMTAKHHEGFALFHSKVDAYNSYDASPCKRDFIKELSDACAKYDMRFGIYYSQEIDWHELDGGAYGDFEKNVGGMSWTNDWDFEEKDKNYERVFRKKILPQVEELMTNYGKISLVWFDTPFIITKEQSMELFNTVKRLQPECMINSRIGNGVGDYISLGDNEVPDENVHEKKVEAVITLNDTWGFKAYDQNWKSAEKVEALRKKLNALNINMLLNIGPDALGRFPSASVKILKDLTKYREER